MAERDKALEATADEHALIKDHPGGRTIDVARKNAFIAGANWQRDRVSEVIGLTDDIMNLLLDPPFELTKRSERWVVLQVDTRPIGKQKIPSKYEYSCVYDDEIKAKIGLKLHIAGAIAKKLSERLKK